MKNTGSTEYATRLEALLSPERRAHSERVAELAREIALASGLDGDRAYLAGLLHDIAKELPETELLRLAPPENEAERSHPLVLHGRAGRRLVEGWGLRDPEILEAIEGHVYGVLPGHGLGMAVYVADAAEPERGFNDDLRALALAGRLQEAYRLAVERKVAYLKQRGIPVHPRTLEVMRELEALA